MPWITAAQLKARLAAVLRCDPASLAQDWDSVVADSVSAGYLDVSAALYRLGYTPTQADQWDRNVEFNIDQSLYWCLVKGSFLIDFDIKEKVERLNRLKEMSSKADPPFTMTIGGVPQSPAAGTLTGDPVGGSNVASGRLSESGYRFGMDTDF